MLAALCLGGANRSGAETVNLYDTGFTSDMAGSLALGSGAILTATPFKIGTGQFGAGNNTGNAVAGGLFTALSSSDKASIDDNRTAGITEWEDYIGVNIDFSAPALVTGFTLADIGGLSPGREAAAVYAFNGSTPVGVTYFPIGAELTLENVTVFPNPPLAPSGAAAPASLDSLFHSGSTGNYPDTDPIGQAGVGFASAVTDIYVLFGLRQDVSAEPGGSQHISISSFDVQTVPEPASAVLMATGAFWLFRRPRRLRIEMAHLGC